MKKIIYIVLVIIILFVVSFFAKEKSTPPIAYNSTNETIEAVEVIETSPDVTGDEQETIVKE